MIQTDVLENVVLGQMSLNQDHEAGARLTTFMALHLSNIDLQFYFGHAF